MMERFDIVVVGELNVDLILNNLPSLPEEGKEILAGAMNLTLGSSSAIFASNAAVLNNRVAFIGKTGDDSFGNLVSAGLQSKGVNTEYIIRSSTEKTGATIVLNYGEDRAMVTYQGAMETLAMNDIDEDALVRARHLHVSSIFLQPELKKEIITLFKKAKSLGLTTSLDMQWDPGEKWDLDLDNLLPLVDIFLPNEVELLAITKTKTVDDAIEILRPLINIMAIKMGNRGSRGVTKKQDVFQQPFLNNSVVDAIGAGDSFNAGFITKYIAGEPLKACLRYGNLVGAVNTTGSGGTGAFSNFEEFRNRAKKFFGMSV